jgi:hypothetical protein
MLSFLAVAIAVVVGLSIGCDSIRSSGGCVYQVTPTVSASLSLTLTPSSRAAATQDAISATLPTPVSQTVTPTPQPCFEGSFVYGTSFDGRPLMAYRLGTGPSVKAIIGGIHGGYEWNTVVLVSETLKYLQESPILVPEDVTLYIVPCANPDGYAAGTDLEHGRMNGNGVDLNRNWGYHWQPTATHGTRPVNAGTLPFSEPETSALRDFILERNVTAAIFYHSAMARIFYGAERDCSATYQLAQEVSDATGYPISAGVLGQISTGDAVDWMSARGLAGIEVELTTHEDIEWERNLQGLLAFLDWPPPPSPAPIVQTTHVGTSVQGKPTSIYRWIAGIRRIRGLPHFINLTYCRIPGENSIDSRAVLCYTEPGSDELERLVVCRNWKPLAKAVRAPWRPTSNLSQGPPAVKVWRAFAEECTWSAPDHYLKSVRPQLGPGR